MAGKNFCPGAKSYNLFRDYLYLITLFNIYILYIGIFAGQSPGYFAGQSPGYFAGQSR